MEQYKANESEVDRYETMTDEEWADEMFALNGIVPDPGYRQKAIASCLWLQAMARAHELSPDEILVYRIITLSTFFKNRDNAELPLAYFLNEGLTKARLKKALAGLAGRGEIGFTMGREGAGDNWQFVVVPRDIIQNPALSRLAQIVYGFLLMRGRNHGGQSWWGQRAIARQLRTHQPTVNTALKQLVQAGLVEVRQKGGQRGLGGTTSLYSVVNPGAMDYGPWIEAGGKPQEKKKLPGMSPGGKSAPRRVEYITLPGDNLDGENPLPPESDTKKLSLSEGSEGGKWKSDMKKLSLSEGGEQGSLVAEGPLVAEHLEIAGESESDMKKLSEKEHTYINTFSDMKKLSLSEGRSALEAPLPTGPHNNANTGEHVGVDVTNDDARSPGGPLAVGIMENQDNANPQGQDGPGSLEGSPSQDNAHAISPHPPLRRPPSPHGEEDDDGLSNSPWNHWGDEKEMTAEDEVLELIRDGISMRRFSVDKGCDLAVMRSFIDWGKENGYTPEFMRDVLKDNHFWYCAAMDPDDLTHALRMAVKDYEPE